MKARWTTWISALLLLFAASAGVPVTHAYATNRVSCCCVYSQQREHRAEQVAEAAAPPRAAASPYRVSAAAEPPAAITLPFSLFQRPPPALSF